MSGEQAEERTAREGRAMKWLVAEVTPRDIGAQITWQFTDEETAELLADYAQAECSRLASRVEELENALEKISKSKKYHEARLTGESMSVLNDAIWVAEKLLAGAHAEEK